MKYELELDDTEKLGVISAMDLLEQFLCDSNPDPKANAEGIEKTRALCNKVRDVLQ